MALVDHSLWPPRLFDSPPPESAPARLLREQAEHLSQESGGNLRGEVGTYSDGDMLLLRLIVVAPALNGFRYTLLRVEQSGRGFPATLVAGETRVPVEDESELAAALQDALASEETEQVIGSLLATIEAQSGPVPDAD